MKPKGLFDRLWFINVLCNKMRKIEWDLCVCVS